MVHFEVEFEYIYAGWLSLHTHIFSCTCRGHSFFSTNAELLEVYSHCNSAAEVIEAQNKWLEEAAAGRPEWPTSSSDGSDSGGSDSGSSDADEGEDTINGGGGSGAAATNTVADALHQQLRLQQPDQQQDEQQQDEQQQRRQRQQRQQRGARKDKASGGYLDDALLPPSSSADGSDASASSDGEG
jgi:pre-rRNA-processing protein TSR3